MFKSTGINILNAKQNRKVSTHAETILWQLLRDRKFMNLKFRRQHAVQNYILDFFCYELNLAIEVDGKYHEEEMQRIDDEKRTAVLNALGIKILRLRNEDASNGEIVLEKLKSFIESNKAPSPLGEGWG